MSDCTKTGCRYHPVCTWKEGRDKKCLFYSTWDEDIDMYVNFPGYEEMCNKLGRSYTGKAAKEPSGEPDGEHGQEEAAAGMVNSILGLMEKNAGGKGWTIL